MIRESFSDLRFTDANRVPFPFMRLMRERGTAVGIRYSKENVNRGRISSDFHHTFSDSGGSLTLATFRSMLPTIALQWFLLTLTVVLGHTAYLVWKHDFRSSMIWLVKLVTDPVTDIFAYYSSVFRTLMPSLGRKSTAT